MTDCTAVRELCERLVPGTIPRLVEVNAPHWAVPDECTENVARVIEEHGGESVYGWKLIEPLPGLLIEAEFHAVLLNAKGDLLDVTPSAFSVPHTVFLADPNLGYEGRQINSVRVPLVDDPLIAELVQAFDADFEAMNRGELAEQHGEIAGTPEIEASKQRLSELFAQIVSKHY